MITAKGFISAVEYKMQKDHTDQLPEVLRPWTEDQLAKATRKQKREHQKLVESGFILARARVHDDLEQLRPYFADLMIVEDKGADYKFRAVLPRQAFTDAVADAAWDINYDSHFKEVARDRSPADANRYSAMMACWSALNRMGDPKPFYTGYTSPYKGKGSGAGGSTTVGSGMVGSSSAPAYGARTYEWEREFEAKTSSKPLTPFGSGERKQLTSQEALELAEYEIAAAKTRSELDRNDRGDTLEGMIAWLMVEAYDKVDADMHVPQIPYALYDAVFHRMDGAADTLSLMDSDMDLIASRYVLVDALTDLLEDGDLEAPARAAYQEALDDLEGAEEPESLEEGPPAVLGTRLSRCEAAGHHLPQFKHSAASCTAEKHKALPGDARCSVKTAHARHEWSTASHEYACPGLSLESGSGMSMQSINAGGAAYPEASK